MIGRLWIVRVMLAVGAIGTISTLATLTGCVGTGGIDGEIQTASDESEARRRAKLRLELASAYFAQGQTTTALDELKQALAIDPTMSEAYNLRGLIYDGLNDDRLAEESFRRAVQLGPRDGDAMHNYGWFLCQRRRYSEATAQFNQAMGASGYRDVTRTLLALGVCQARAGHLPDAEKSLARSYELDPANPATAMNLAAVLYRRGDYERARFYARRVNNVPALVNAESLWLAARIEYRLGNRAGANDLGRQLRLRFPQSREAAAFDRGAFDE